MCSFLVLQMSENKSEYWWITYRFSWFDKKKRKATRNHFNKNDNKYFQYAITLGVDHKKLGKIKEK